MSARIRAVVLLPVLGWPGLAPCARGAEVVANVFQAVGVTNLTNYITNNDNAIYNSATFDVVGTYGNLLQAIQERKPGYAGMTLHQIGAVVGRTIQPTGEVNDGWEASYSEATGRVTLTNNGFPGAYDVWNSSTPYNDMLALTFNFGNLLDFNGNGQLDEDERLVEVGRQGLGFMGYVNSNNQFYASPPQYEFEWVMSGLGGTGLKWSGGGGLWKLELGGLIGGRRYVLESSVDVEDWDEEEVIEVAGPQLPGERVTLERDVAIVPGGRRYYRLMWEVP